MGMTCRAGIMTAAIAAAFATAGVVRAGDELPRYRLEPGMELAYKGSSTFHHQNGMHLDDEEITAWIVRRNGDGSVRVVLRQGSRFTATSVVETLKNLFKKQDKPPMDYNLGYFDLFPDGRLGPGRRAGIPDLSGQRVPAPARRRRRRQKPGGASATSRWARNTAIRRCGPSPTAGSSAPSGSGPRTRSTA